MPHPANPISVAIVEDDAGVRQRLATILRQSGVCTRADEYANGESALAGVPENPPRVVLMDVNLPGIDGVECVRRLAAACPTCSS